MVVGSSALHAPKVASAGIHAPLELRCSDNAHRRAGRFRRADVHRRHAGGRTVARRERAFVGAEFDQRSVVVQQRHAIGRAVLDAVLRDSDTNATPRELQRRGNTPLNVTACCRRTPPLPLYSTMLQPVISVPAGPSTSMASLGVGAGIVVMDFVETDRRTGSRRAAGSRAPLRNRTTPLAAVASDQRSRPAHARHVTGPLHRPWPHWCRTAPGETSPSNRLSVGIKARGGQGTASHRYCSVALAGCDVTLTTSAVAVRILSLQTPKEFGADGIPAAARRRVPAIYRPGCVGASPHPSVGGGSPSAGPSPAIMPPS